MPDRARRGRSALRPAAEGVAIAALCAATVAVGIAWGTRAAGGSDSYCYMSQAELFASGRVRLDTADARATRQGIPQDAFLPVGYRPAPGADGAAVPICPPGLPLMMAVARLSGGPSAVLLVIPIMGAVVVLLTYLLGRTIAGTATGLASAGMIASSPIFLYQLVQPMSDVAATGWWLLAIWLAFGDTRARAFGAGLATSAAVLTRPNLVPAAAVVALLAGWQGRSISWRQMMTFAAGVVPGCLAVAAVNTAMHGSPLMSGYGATADLFSRSSIAPNFSSYLKWLTETHTPFVLLALAAPLFPWNNGRPGQSRGRMPALLFLAFAGVVLSAYLPYSRFDHWSYVRFLLPAIPLLIVLSVGVVCRALGTLSPRLAVAGAMLVAILGGVHGISQAMSRGVFDLQAFEERFIDAGRFAAEELPENAIVLTDAETGSIRYYAAKPAIAWRAIAPEDLDRSLTALRKAGFMPYLMMEAGEEPSFRERFAGASAAGALDWPPMAEIRTRIPVRVYDPAARSRHAAGEPVRTLFVPPSSKRPYSDDRR